MLVRALIVLRFYETRTDTATAALNQPGDEGWAYDRGQAKWQR